MFGVGVALSLRISRENTHRSRVCRIFFCPSHLLVVVHCSLLTIGRGGWLFCPGNRSPKPHSSLHTPPRHQSSKSTRMHHAYIVQSPDLPAPKQGVRGGGGGEICSELLYVCLVNCPGRSLRVRQTDTQAGRRRGDNRLSCRLKAHPFVLRRKKRINL